MGLSEEPGIKYFWGPTVRSPRSKLNKADHLSGEKATKKQKETRLLLSLSQLLPSTARRDTRSRVCVGKVMD